MVPAVTIGSFGFTLEVVLYFLDLDPFFPFGVIKYIAYVSMGLLTLFTVLMLSFFGKNWLMRRRYFFKNDYGPYLIVTSNPAHEMKICGHASRKTRKQIKDTPKIAYLAYKKVGSEKYTSKPVQFRPRGFWSVKLTDLEENTRYRYDSELFYFQNGKRIEMVLDGDHSEVFTTFKSHHSNYESIEFIYLSDMHASGRDIGWIVDLIAHKFKKIKFIISAGDCVSDSRNFTHWKTLLNQLKPESGRYPILHTTGNHDALIPKMANRWKNVLPYELPEPDSGIYYKVVYGDICFIILDNYNAGNDYPLPSEQQIRWAEKTLKTLPDSIKTKFLVMHEPFYSTCTNGFREDLESSILPLVKKYKISGVFTGHAHYFELFHRKDLGTDSGTTFFVAGGAGGRVEHAIYRKINNPPYLWEGPIHNAQDKFFREGDKESELRNDEYVKRYQKYGFSEKHIVHVRIDQKNIHYAVYGQKGNALYEYIQKK